MADKYIIDLPLFDKPEGGPTELFKDTGIYCPLCKRYYPASLYLMTDIPDPKARWFQNMVTHYRNNHIKSWKRLGGKGGLFFRRNSPKKYHQEKLQVNEKIKRMILRKCAEFMLSHNMDLETLQGLIYNSEYTIKIAHKILILKQQDNTEENFD